LWVRSGNAHRRDTSAPRPPQWTARSLRSYCGELQKYSSNLQATWPLRHRRSDRRRRRGQLGAEHGTVAASAPCLTTRSQLPLRAPTGGGSILRGGEARVLVLACNASSSSCCRSWYTPRLGRAAAPPRLRVRVLSLNPTSGALSLSPSLCALNQTFSR
jgi:hypothetical protein